MTFDEARDDILGIFKSAWDATGNRVVYTDLPDDTPTGNVVWCRATLRHTDGNQASLANHIGQRRWSREGIAYFQVFAPVGDGSKAGYDAAQLVVRAFEGKESCVWFRNVRMRELGSDGTFEGFNVLVNFEYDDIH